MPVKPGDLSLPGRPAAKELLESRTPARLAYIWTDGTPRVIPIWFHWNGKEFILGTPPKARKLKALVRNPRVSLTIDDRTFPPQGPVGSRAGLDSNHSKQSFPNMS
jgi:pyridoxamine 5'-phosphate oxidase-like protein